MAEKESTEPLIDSDKLIFGIGQAQKITGVSGRQLRYWEEQGYITPIDQQKGIQRQYSMHTLFLIFHIQRYLKQGFTLQSAVERARRFDKQIPVLRTFLKNQFNGVEVDRDKSVIDFGYKDATHRQRVYGVVENGETYFQVKEIDDGTSK